MEIQNWILIGLMVLFNRHQLADAVLKITFSVSKIVGNVSYRIT